MTKKILALGVVGVAGIAAIGAGVSTAGASQVQNAKCDVGVLLPDSKSSVRWETAGPAATCSGVQGPA